MVLLSFCYFSTMSENNSQWSGLHIRFSAPRHSGSLESTPHLQVDLRGQTERDIPLPDIGNKSISDGGSAR